MFVESVAISLVASGIAEGLSLSGKEVFQKLKVEISPSTSEDLAEAFTVSLTDQLSSQNDVSPSDLEEIIEPVNEIAVDSVYQSRDEIAKQIAVQLSTSSALTTVPEGSDPKQLVETALDEAVSNWFEQIKGTQTADQFLLEASWETNAQLRAVGEKLDRAIEQHARKKWYTRIDVDDAEMASKEVSRQLESGRPATSDIYVPRPEIPSELSCNKYLIIGRRGMGKTRTLDRLQTELLHEKEIHHVVVPNQEFIGAEDARGFSTEEFKGDVLLVWDDIHGVRAGKQGKTVRETILRLSAILEDSNDSLYVLLSVRAEFTDDIEFFDRLSDRVWGEFERIELQPLDEKTVATLTEQVIAAHELEMDERTQAEIEFEIWYSDPSPLYVESVISTLDGSGDIRKQLEELPSDVSGIWEQQYDRLIAEYPETRFILWGIDLLRMGAIPIYESTIRRVYTEVFNRDEFGFDQPLRILKEKQWIWETENPGPDVEDTVYDIRAAQLSAVDEDRMRVVERYADFLLGSFAETIPEEVTEWIPHYHSNTGMFFAHDLVGDTRSLAEPQLEQADELAPFDPVIQNNYAAFLLLDGRPEEALEHYEKALTVAPEWAALRNTYATTLDELNRPYEAVEQYEKAIKSEQPQPVAHYNLGTLYTELEEFQSAKEEYEKALSKGYHTEELYNNLGTICWSLGDYLRGKEILEKGVAQFPNARELRYNLAGLLYEIEYPNRSVEILLPLLEGKETGDSRLHGRLAQAYSDLGEQELTEKHAQIAKKTPGKNPLDSNFLEEVKIQDVSTWEDKSDLLRVVDALLRDENYAKAWEKGKDLLKERDDSSRIRQRMGDIAAELTRYEEAEEHYKRAISLDEENGKAFHHYANFLKHRGRNMEAREKFEDAIAVSDSSVVNNDYGLLLFKMGEYAAAASRFERGLELVDSDTVGDIEKRLHLNYGQLLFYAGGSQHARKHYEQAIDIDGEYANAKFGLGQLEAEQNRVESAVTLLQEALRLHAEEGRIDKWKKALFEMLSILEVHERYEAAIEQCEYAIDMMVSIGRAESPVVYAVQSRKIKYEDNLPGSQG